jgi:methylmalonyl-CoA mutase cobalamin-binding subunit
MVVGGVIPSQDYQLFDAGRLPFFGPGTKSDAAIKILEILIGE